MYRQNIGKKNGDKQSYRKGKMTKNILPIPKRTRKEPKLLKELWRNQAPIWHFQMLRKDLIVLIPKYKLQLSRADQKNIERRTHLKAKINKRKYHQKIRIGKQQIYNPMVLRSSQAATSEIQHKGEVKVVNKKYPPHC